MTQICWDTPKRNKGLISWDEEYCLVENKARHIREEEVTRKYFYGTLQNGKYPYFYDTDGV